MATQFSKVKNAVYSGLNLAGDYLEGKLSALYRIGQEKGMTTFGYQGSLEEDGYPDLPDYDETEEEEVETQEEDRWDWERFVHWLFTFAEINDEYVQYSHVFFGVTYTLQDGFIRIDRYQPQWDGPVYDDRSFDITPYTAANIKPLMDLMEQISQEMGVDLDAI